VRVVELGQFAVYLQISLAVLLFKLASRQARFVKNKIVRGEASSFYIF
jgi:hypothetical protein